MKTEEEVIKFVDRVDQKYPFKGLGTKRKYSDIRACVLSIIYDLTESDKEDRFGRMRRYVGVEVVADIVGINHSGIYAALRKRSDLLGIYPDFSELYENIKNLI